MIFTKNEFGTSDLAIVAYLWNEGSKILRITNNGEKKEFIFKKNPILSELLDTYWSRDARVEPIKYFSSLREVKNLIYRA